MPRRTPTPKKKATISDVARTAGVSTVSVSRVINNLPSVREGTRKAVHRAMLELGYTPNLAAQMLRTRRSNTIGCVVTDLSNTATALIVHAAEQELNKSGNLLVTASTDMDVRREAHLIDTLGQRSVDGLILQPADEDSPLVRDAIARCGVPVVLIDREIDVVADRVLVEHYEAMRQVVRYLVDLGHRDIAIIASESGTRPARERVRAFRDEMAAHGLSVRANRVCYGSHLEQHGFDSTEVLMSDARRPTALIAAGNLIMLGAIKALMNLKISVPRELSVVGADDIVVSELMNPSLTIIDRDMAALGREAARLLVRRITSTASSATEKRTLSSRVLLRASCAPAPTSA